MTAPNNQRSVTGLVLCVTAWSLLAVCTATERCVVCNYNFAGDGTTDFECVDDPFGHVLHRNITCDFDTYTCVVKAVYNADYSRLTSVGRLCLLTSSILPDGCDDTSSISHTCYLRCNQDLCNVQDGRLYDRFNNGNTGDGGNGGSRATSDVFLVALMLSVVCSGRY